MGIHNLKSVRFCGIKTNSLFRFINNHITLKFLETLYIIETAVQVLNQKLTLPLKRIGPYLNSLLTQTRLYNEFYYYICILIFQHSVLESYLQFFPIFNKCKILFACLVNTTSRLYILRMLVLWLFFDGAASVGNLRATSSRQQKKKHHTVTSTPFS